MYPDDIKGPPPAQSDAIVLDGTVPEAQVVYPVNEHGAAAQHHSGNVVVPQGGTGTVVTGNFAVFEGRRRFIIKQKLDIGEAIAQQLGCPCCEQANKFRLFDAETGEEIMLITEESNIFCRACLHPHHRLELNFIDTRYGVPPDTHVMHGKKPCKCNCCICADICRHEIKVKNENGEHFAHAKMPYFGGGLSPKIELMDREGHVHTTTTGPTCCLGGLVELCQSIEFDISREKTGQKVGKIIKVKPDDFKGALKEAAGDADTYELIIPEDCTPEQTAAILAQTILLDYLFFEDGAPIRYNPWDNSLTVNFCNCFCLGCICPCSCTCGGNNGNN